MTDRYIDFHCHLLPGMDFDGTDSMEESAKMCELLKSQGVATICATPHFYPWNEDMKAFLARRDAAFHRARALYGDMRVVLGAEVQLYENLCDAPADRMCYGDSNVILLELPDRPFGAWTVPAIENTVFKYSLTPVIAHVERYGLTTEQIRSLAAIPRVIFQITVETLAKRQMLPLLDRIASMGVPVVLGSDTHNMTSRPPHFDVPGRRLAEKPHLFDSSCKTAQALIRNALHGQQILERLICTPAAKR